MSSSAGYSQEPRHGFTKATVSASRVTLKERGLRSSSIVIRMSAIRKLALETTDLVAPEVVSRDAIHILKGVDTANASLYAGILQKTISGGKAMQTVQFQTKKTIEELRRSPYHQQLGSNVCAAFIARQQGIKLDTALRRLTNRSAISGS